MPELELGFPIRGGESLGHVFCEKHFFSEKRFFFSFEKYFFVREKNIFSRFFQNLKNFNENHTFS